MEDNPKGKNYFVGGLQDEEARQPMENKMLENAKEAIEKHQEVAKAKVLPFDAKQFGLIPTEDRVIVFPDIAPEKYQAKIDIIIPENQREFHKPPSGVIVAVGPGFPTSKNSIPYGYRVNGVFVPAKALEDMEIREDDRVVPMYPMAHKVGDHVYYGMYAGTPVSHQGRDYLIMRPGDCFAIISRAE